MVDVADSAYIDRDVSLITLRKTVIPIADFPRFPVFIGCTEAPRKDDLFADMRFDICTESGMIQLGRLLAPDLVYGGFHSEAVGQLWADHHAAFAAFASPYIGDRVLEPGGSNGKIAALVLQEVIPTEWAIVEPAPPRELPTIFEAGVVSMRQGYLENIEEPSVFDTVVHSHTMEHSYDPNEFLSCVSRALAPGQKHVFSIPNLGQYLNQKFANTLNFEHTFFLDEKYCEYLLARHGFSVCEKKYFGEHSVFYATERQAEVGTPILENRYAENRRLFQDFVDFYKTECARVVSEIKRCDAKIYMFGAHIFTQFLIYLGVDENRVVAVLDNSAEKQGKRLYGTGLRVQSPGVLAGEKNVLVILKAGQYQDEVRKQLLEINPECRLIE